jgi:Lrp/AsnC family transcriptional regulator
MLSSAWPEVSWKWPARRWAGRRSSTAAISAKRFVVDPEAVGFEFLVFCFVKISHHQRERLRAFEEAVARVPEVMQCYSLSGEYDYVLQVIAASVRDYESTVKNAIVELPNVQSINTSFTLKRVKNTLNVPV